MRTLERRTWYIITNSVLGLWMLAAIVAVSAHRVLPHSTWLMVHLTMLGAVSTAILIWSQHFADTLTRRQAPGGRLGLGIRLGLHTVGAVCVVAGILADALPVILTGAALVAAAALTHATIMTLQLRGALTSRFGPLVRFYAVSALWLVVGVGLGFWMSQLLADDPLRGRLFVAHVAVNLLGWVGTTVLGTVILFWPTVLHARMRPTDGRRSPLVLTISIFGLVLVLVGAGAGVLPLVAAGVVVWLCALALVLFEGIRQTKDAARLSYAGLSIGAALCWLAVSAGFLAAGVGSASGWDEAVDRLAWIVQPFVAGFAVQIVLGALSYLLPVIMGRPNARKAAETELDRGAVFRAATINIGMVAYLLPVPSVVKVLLSVVVFALFITVVVLAVRGIIVGLRERKTEPAPATHTPGEQLRIGAKPRQAKPKRAVSGQLVTAASVVLLTVAGGIAIDPAAAGINTLAGSEAQATGETTTIEVTVDGMRFVPDVLEVPAGDELVVEFTNTGTDIHDLTFANGVSSERLAPGDSETIDVGVISEDMEGWCSVTGHRAMGMELSVVAVGAGDASDDAADGHHNHGTTSDAGDSAAADLDFHLSPDAGFVPYDAELDPAPAGTVHEITLPVTEEETEVAPGVTQTLWTFDGTAPGPVLRGSVGDTFKVTLVNDGTMGHSIDFHAGVLAPDEPMRTIMPGESLEYTFTATRAGIWMYHCATMPMSSHIANGMFGAVIIDPPDLAPVDHEFVMVQSEFYLGSQGGPVDPDAVATQLPDIVAFNGYANQYRDVPLEVQAGDTVRFWVLNAGPNVTSSFHVIGGQFHTVWKEGDYTLKDGGSTGVGGSQALGLTPAQGGFVELTFPEAGTYPFVSHVMSDAEKGATGAVHVS
ncbi:multicopper oxidase domain-containing protein [Microbacterium sp. MPKO10]|uniref:multicopper oxidase domain-containing protein n=1 Tax=Microbacterium sp. MPKO10 TaxID=2989818 RepID=UPI00223643A0|nr:multicopper oxidase domain-containing protein [Microbacterium sp. MPKO10]MCW4456723.1 multicopper oxidase domain-containing protein [Microbacterium sp. MPKO10]